MPKGRQGKGGRGKIAAADKKKERAVRRALRTERAYLQPGDPDFKSFSNQLAVQGLRLEDVPADGNCLFRALARQLVEPGVSHVILRREVVHFMRQNPQQFETFLAEDDNTYEEYLGQLSQDGEYAGNDAIVAFSRAFSANVIIHQLSCPRWEVLTPPTASSPQQPPPTLHVAYLNGEHYCSVCPLTGGSSLSHPRVSSSANSSSLETRAGGCGVGASRGGTTAGPSPSEGRGEEEGELTTLLSATGCEDRSLAEGVLADTGYDVDQAVVELLQLMELSRGEKDSPQSPNEVCKEKKKFSTKKPPQAPSKVHVSNRERKALAKAERKERRREERGRGRNRELTTDKCDPGRQRHREAYALLATQKHSRHFIRFSSVPAPHVLAECYRGSVFSLLQLFGVWPFMRLPLPSLSSED